MALIMPILINDTTIGGLTIVRTEMLDKREFYTYNYELVFNGGMTLRGDAHAAHYSGSVTHGYRDGAGVLIKKVLEDIYDV